VSASKAAENGQLDRLFKGKVAAQKLPKDKASNVRRRNANQATKKRIVHQGNLN
jgi:hypothetical protein